MFSGSASLRGWCVGRLVGQGLVHPLHEDAPDHRTATVKAMMRNPVIAGTPPLRYTHEAPKTPGELWDDRGTVSFPRTDSVPALCRKILSQTA